MSKAYAKIVELTNERKAEINTILLDPNKQNLEALLMITEWLAELDIFTQVEILDP